MSGVNPGLDKVPIRPRLEPCDMQSCLNACPLRKERSSEPIRSATGLGKSRSLTMLAGMSKYAGEQVLVVPRALFDEIGAFEGIRTEDLNAALKARVIGAGTYSELLAAIGHRKNELRKPAAA